MSVDTVRPRGSLRAGGYRADLHAESAPEFYANLYRAAIRQPSVDADPPDAPLGELGETDVRFREGAESAREEFDEIGLITNGGEQTQTAKLETLGIEGAFDVTVFCDLAEGIEPKPATEPFEVALAGLDATPAPTAYVGDTHGSDVVGAHRAGLQSAWAPVDRPHEQVLTNPEPAPTYRLGSVAELPTVL